MEFRFGLMATTCPLAEQITPVGPIASERRASRVMAEVEDRAGVGAQMWDVFPVNPCRGGGRVREQVTYRTSGGDEAVGPGGAPASSPRSVVGSGYGGLRKLTGLAKDCRNAVNSSEDRRSDLRA